MEGLGEMHQGNCGSADETADPGPAYLNKAHPWRALASSSHFLEKYHSSRPLSGYKIGVNNIRTGDNADRLVVSIDNGDAVDLPFDE